ncbi:MAG: DNA-directed RNA polymerase subunit omega [Candidatus Omnitrophota bacterium]
MAYSISVESLLDKTNNSIYKLVILASRRALEIAEGQPKLVEGDSVTKPSTLALREISAGKVTAQKTKSKE